MTPRGEKVCRIVEASSLGLAAIFTFTIMLYTDGWYFTSGADYLAVLSPYVVFFVLSQVVGRAAGAGCITAVLMLAFTVFVYGDSVFVHTTSTSALIFIFAPVYMLVGGPAFFGILIAIRSLIRVLRHESTESGISTK